MENEGKEPAPKYNYVPAEEYLEMERASGEKHEYYKGEVFTIAGASLRHVTIAKNLNRLVLPFLYDKPCDMYGNDLRVHIPENTLYTYPDFSIVCGKPETTDGHNDTITNPAVIIEILSKSTRDYDRGTKFFLYRSLPTLKEYLLVDSTGISVELFSRDTDNSWKLTEYKTLQDGLTIQTIGLFLELRDIYEEIEYLNPRPIDYENIVSEPAPKYNYIPEEEYLEAERSATEKHEYYKGEIFAMAGASMRHNDLFHNLYGILVPALKGKSCKPYGSDLRVHVRDNSLYTYPDISIVCGKPETTDGVNDTITNPAVIIEILSKSTRDYDRGTKFFLYRSLPTLKEYLLVDSTEISVELFLRHPDNSWQLTEFKNLPDSFTIQTIGLTLQLRDIYEGIDF